MRAGRLIHSVGSGGADRKQTGRSGGQIIISPFHGVGTGRSAHPTPARSHRLLSAQLNFDDFDALERKAICIVMAAVRGAETEPFAVSRLSFRESSARTGMLPPGSAEVAKPD